MPVCTATLSPLHCLHYMHGCLLSCHSLHKIYGNISSQLQLIAVSAQRILPFLFSMREYMQIYAFYMFMTSKQHLLRTLQVLCCKKQLHPQYIYHHPHPSTILQSLRVQAPKSIERKKSAPWSSPYICQGGKAGGAALMGRTGEQYHSICHKPFHL